MKRDRILGRKGLEDAYSFLSSIKIQGQVSTHRFTLLKTLERAMGEISQTGGYTNSIDFSSPLK